MAAAQEVGDLLEDYARRGIFRGFSRASEGAVQGRYRVLWHRDQLLDWRWDGRRGSLRVAQVLPNVPARSPMDREFRAWLAARQDAGLPEHRRCDPERLALRARNRGGEIELTATVLDGDARHGVRKLVALVNEVYLDFIANGPYFDWQVETFDLDPDQAN